MNPTNAPSGFDHDTKGTAKQVSVSTKTLDDWAWKKINLPYAVVGGKRWYRQSDIDHYLFKREVKVRAPKKPRGKN